MINEEGYYPELHKRKRGTWWEFIAICVFLMALADKADAQPNVCAGLDSGKVDVDGPAALTLTAPDGFLISGYCVKAGSAKQGLGPEYVTVDPPLSTVTIAHTSGKDISHYALEYTPWPSPTPTPEPTSVPTPTVSSTPTPKAEPSPSPRSTPSATPMATPPVSNETPPASPTSKPEPKVLRTEDTPTDGVTPGETFGSSPKSERKTLAYTGDWTSWQARADAAEALRDLEEYKDAIVKYVRAGKR